MFTRKGRSTPLSGQDSGGLFESIARLVLDHPQLPSDSVIGGNLEVCRQVGDKLMVMVNITNLPLPPHVAEHLLTRTITPLVPKDCTLSLAITSDTNARDTNARDTSAPTAAPNKSVKSTGVHAAGTVGTSVPAASVLEGVNAVVLVASGKGGVGKSTIAAQLATALARSGKAVGLLDCDIYGPSLPLQFPDGLGQNLGKPEVHEPSGKLLPFTFAVEGSLPPAPGATPSGGTPSGGTLALMSMGFLVRGDTSVVWRGPMLMKALRQFFFDVAWDYRLPINAADRRADTTALDVLVCDLPPGTGDVPLTICQAIGARKAAILVSTPQEIAAIDARKAHDMFQKMAVPVLGVVENMASFVCDSCTTVHHPFGAPGGLAASLHLPALATLPIDSTMAAGNTIGVLNAAVSEESARQLAQVVASVEQWAALPA